MNIDQAFVARGLGYTPSFDDETDRLTEENARLYTALCELAGDLNDAGKLRRALDVLADCSGSAA